MDTALQQCRNKGKSKQAIRRKVADTQWDAAEPVLKNVYLGTIHPHLDYGSTTCSSASKTLNYTLDSIQNQGTKRHSLQAVELSQRTQAAVQIVSNLPAQQWGPDLPFFGHAGHADPLDGWRCCSQGRVMSRPIQVRQLWTGESGFVMSAMGGYMSESRCP